MDDGQDMGKDAPSAPAPAMTDAEWLIECLRCRKRAQMTGPVLWNTGAGLPKGWGLVEEVFALPGSSGWYCGDCLPGEQARRGREAAEAARMLP